MEKNRIRPVKAGKGMRMSYSRQKDVLDIPNLIEVQRDSYDWFCTEGLREVLDSVSPIESHDQNLSLEFIDFEVCEDEKKYSIEECKERDATYSAPLRVKVRLHNKETGEITEHTIFMGDLPLMTKTGTFVINGAERVIVSQLVRSPGIYFDVENDKIGKELYSSQIIPIRGAWLEYETDSNDIFNVRVDRARKVPVTTLVRALGVSSNEEILEMFGDEAKIKATLEKDNTDDYESGLKEVYAKIRPGEPFSKESAENIIGNMFFDDHRYDLARVGRYKYNKKLAYKNRIVGFTLAESVVDQSTGEIIARKGKLVDEETAIKIQNAAVPYVLMEAGSGKYGSDLNNILRRIDNEERRCRDILIKTSNDGVIGS